ncbi:DUF2059 domain-containing protein [Alisedimentitalea sp. MJ-SS2]|uniref:DUF2059 domain-containing protein n=1 Tax=Aliisedimentitalea sp. MJ-SS2 TaxID=3049795 RepID=UPI00291447D9|nr:DUF2059 domain-containing protein [Alisedimentitalea sp. MJ-SS2]MDU8926996.1 DUF2059 domain-containing protein [Alisedimentitalea sp. MJ-SS2]
MPHRAIHRGFSPFLAGVFALMCALVGAFYMANRANAADRDRVEAFLQVTGFDVALDSIALAAEDAPTMLGLRAEEFGYQWTQAAEEVFDRNLMHGMALDILEKALSEELLTHAAAFYASPLGLRLVEVENASHMDEDDEGRRKAGEALLETMRQEDPDRLALFERMNDAIDSSGMSVRAVQEIQFRFLMAAVEAGVVRLRLDEEELRAMLKEDEEEMKARMAASGLATSAHTYRGFSTDEVRTYTEALEDERMKQVYVLMNAIQWEVMANRFEALAVRMAGMDRGEEL